MKVSNTECEVEESGLYLTLLFGDWWPDTIIMCASNAYIAIGFTTVTPLHLINLKSRSIVVYLGIVEMVNIS